MGIFIYKELNNMHPEQTDTIFHKVDNIHSYHPWRKYTEIQKKTMSNSGSVL